MLELLNVTVWIDPDKPKALEGYRDVLKILKTHPEVMDDDKMTIYLLDLNSKHSNNLVDIYFGLFKVKDISKIKMSMTELFRILLTKIAPSLIMFTLEEHDEKVTLILTEVSENSPEERSPTKKEDTIDDTVERIAQYSMASNLTPAIQTSTLSAPIQQVQAGAAASVASSVTVSAKKGLSTSSACTPKSQSRHGSGFEPEVHPVTPNLKTSTQLTTVIHMDKILATTETQDTLHAAKSGHTFDLGTLPASEKQ